MNVNVERLQLSYSTYMGAQVHSLNRYIGMFHRIHCQCIFIVYVINDSWTDVIQRALDRHFDASFHSIQIISFLDRIFL